jgi:hypothetical protein
MGANLSGTNMVAVPFPFALQIVLLEDDVVASN